MTSQGHGESLKESRAPRQMDDSENKSRSVPHAEELCPVSTEQLLLVHERGALKARTRFGLIHSAFVFQLRLCGVRGHASHTTLVNSTKEKVNKRTYVNRQLVRTEEEAGFHLCSCSRSAARKH